MTKTSAVILSLAAAITISSCGNDSSNNNNNTTSQPAETGEAIYSRTCIACHLGKGEGVPGTFPPLAKSDYLGNRQSVIKQVLKGSTGDLVVNGTKYNNTMPPQHLSDAEVASVLTYVYSSFGNTGTPVTADEVKQVRTKLQ